MRQGLLADLKRECLPRLALQALWKENEVFSKLLYRGKNQHRHDKSFQMMTRVSSEGILYHTLHAHIMVVHVSDPFITFRFVGT